MADTDLPLVISCQGGTPTARLAAEVAAALDNLDVAEAVEDLDQALTAARAGRRLIALDGCPSGCRSRLLEVKGVPPAPPVNLADLGVDAETVSEADPARLAAEIAARWRSRRPVGRHAPRQRRAGPEQAPRTKQANAVNDYLLAIDSLASTTVDCGALTADAPTHAAHVSRLLGVSRASAGEMLARLELAGLVERGARKELLLTAGGRAAADTALMRHRLLERLAGDFLGYPPHECYERARVLDDAFDDDALERVRRALGDPGRCPHGWPIDPVHARAESRELTTLAALAAGREATVVRLAEHDGPLLAGLFELGLVPGTRLWVGDRPHPTAGISVRTGGTVQRLDQAAALQVFVREGARA